ncbi:MAG: signal recognition particle-docking protein FtsY [Thermodesulfatator sp.]|nr:MAG: signal recognition particle-docking protein FtsY [Thermodesulfatator sp.]
MKEWIKKAAGFGDFPESEPESEIEEQGKSPDENDNQNPDNADDTPEQTDAPEQQSVEHGRDEPQAEDRLFARLRDRMAKSRLGFVRQMDELFLGKRQIDPELLDELEEILVMADMGVSTVQEIFDEIRLRVSRNQLTEPEALKQALKGAIEDLFDQAEKEAGGISWEPVPYVILVVGVNGVGKTTTIAKLAFQLKQQGKKVMLVAADTFRAAAVEQLEMWGEKTGVPVISHKSGSDPSAVAFDGLEAAKAQGMDVVIVDTAGRLHTQVNLMEELKKIKRVMGRKMKGAPHEVFLVLDATTGQNAISQAKMFCDATDVTGICLTKLDGTAKGGIVASIAHQMKIPIRYIGIGERMEDLRPFDSKEFVDALFQ